MARRKNELTPADTTGTPTDSTSAPPVARDSTPLPLPKPPSIPRPPRLPPPGPPAVSARPGRRSETPSDLSMTSKIQRAPRGDPTPAPLPPSPGARDAERWFEQVPTNPAAQPSGAAEITGSHRKSGRMERSGLMAGQPVPRFETPWLVMILIAAIALTIGMILGALLFSKDAAKCDPCDETVQPKQ